MVIILNFGSQFAHLIARRVRDLGVKAEILPFDTSSFEILKHNPIGIILSGGPASVLEKGSPRPDKAIYKLGIPILGICYGHQVMAHMLGGKVTKGKHREFGKENLVIKNKSGVFQTLSSKEIVWFSHGDQVSVLPKGFKQTASTAGCKYAAFADAKSNFYGIQFHPEVTHTPLWVNFVDSPQFLYTFIKILEFDPCFRFKVPGIVPARVDFLFP
jgi:GMP synthase (glutamine-hydrolysing)